MKTSLGKRLVLYGLALLAALYLAVPFLWVALTSLKPEREVSQSHWIPKEPTLENYALYFDLNNRSAEIGAATARQFPRAIANSLIIGLAVALINLFFGSLAAYALARVDFKGNLLLMLFYLGSRSVPGVAIMIPMYLVVRSYGLLDTHLAVILAHSTFTLPFSVWILKGYFQTVPIELELAARVDGCSRMGALFRIFLPVTKPALAAVGIFAFIASWGEFLFALLFTSTLHAKTATVLTSDFAQETAVPFSLVAAGGILVVLLPIGIAFFFQRFIIHGIGGSVKG